jgi:hypothetical protein
MARSGATARSHHPLETTRTDTKTLFAHVTGGGAATSCTLDAQSALNGEITALTYASTGVYNGTFRFVYPQLVGAPIVSFGGATTAGIMGVVTAIDVVTAGTFTVKFYVGNTLTDLATTDIPYFTWSVRASGKNS